MNTATLTRPSTNTQRRNKGVETPILSDRIILTVPGEYYAYSSEFTARKPVYALISCKSNKNRMTTEITNLGDNANLLFLFDASRGVTVFSVREASDWGILNDSLQLTIRTDTLITETKISVEEFNNIREKRDTKMLVEICKAVPQKATTFISMKPNLVISVITSDGKYGLFLVKEVSKSSIKIDACHVLL